MKAICSSNDTLYTIGCGYRLFSDLVISLRSCFTTKLTRSIGSSGSALHFPRSVHAIAMHRQCSPTLFWRGNDDDGLVRHLRWARMKELVRHDQQFSCRYDPALSARWSVRIQHAKLILIGASSVSLVTVGVVRQRVANLDQNVIEADRPFRVCEGEKVRRAQPQRSPLVCSPMPGMAGAPYADAPPYGAPPKGVAPPPYPAP